MKDKPCLLAWITCDAVHIDPLTGKHTILGAFSHIRSGRYPLTYPFMVWFITLTGCASGEHTLKVSMGMNPSNVAPLMERPFRSQDPLQRINLINEVTNLSFPKAGEYSIVVDVDGETLLVTNLILTD